MYKSNNTNHQIRLILLSRRRRINNFERELMSTHIVNDEQLRSHQLLFVVNMAAVLIHTAFHVYLSTLLTLLFERWMQLWGVDSVRFS